MLVPDGCYCCQHKLLFRPLHRLVLLQIIPYIIPSLRHLQLPVSEASNLSIQLVNPAT